MRIRVIEGDASSLAVDVLALKYAQARYGLDSYVYERLIEAGHQRREMSPRPGDFSVVSSTDVVSARHVLFVGTGHLSSLNYLGIRVLGRTVLSALSQALPEASTVALTVHGPNYGLDEAEAFESMIAGFVDALESGEAPKQLEVLSIAEIDCGRAERLRASLSRLLPDGLLRFGVKLGGGASRERLRSVGYASPTKPHVFVAMPFSEGFDDVYHYGILGAVNRRGILCERADLSTFTGDILSWIRKRIQTASLLIADLTTANPNVYLEVGYAWGCGVPTVLLAREPNELKFDVRGQRCLVYRRIKDLEETLEKELDALSRQGGG